MTHAKRLTLATSGFATLALGNAPALAQPLVDHSLDLSDTDIAMVGKTLHATCEQPANRDFHAVLSAFNGSADDAYKFSGCGSAI